MYLTTAEAARQLNVSQRQIRRVAASGRISSAQYGRSYLLSTREIRSLGRTAQRGRNWSAEAQQAALDLLSNGATDALGASAKSRLRARLRSVSLQALAGQVLRGRVTFRSTLNIHEKALFVASIAEELGLSAQGGLSIFVAEQAGKQARQHKLVEDSEGEIAVVEGAEQHRQILEALVFYAYGNTRERDAAESWLQQVRKAL